MEKIGVLTSGGDAPGMNACIRVAVRAALANNIEISGIRWGYTGLIHGECWSHKFAQGFIWLSQNINIQISITGEASYGAVYG